MFRPLEAIAITVSLTRDMQESIPQLVANASHRLRSIWISTKNCSHIERLLSCYRPAPLLEFLHVGAYGSRSNADFDGPVAPTMFFRGDVPSLRYLVLRDVQLLFTPPSTLRHLELSAHGSVLPSVGDILSYLGNCPDLENLKLAGPCHGWSIVGRSSVELTKLQSLLLKLEFPAANANLLSKLSLSEQTDIYIAVILDEDEDFGEVIHAYDPNSPHSLRCLNKVRAVQLYWRDYELWMRALRDVDQHFDYHCDAALEIAVSAEWGDFPQAVEGFLDGQWPFDASHVEALNITLTGLSEESDEDEEPLELMRSQQWAAVLDSLPALKTVSLSVFHHLELDPLVDLWSGKDGESYSPKLQSLEFRTLNMSERTMEGVYNIAVKRLHKVGDGNGGFKELFFCDCGTPSQDPYVGDEWAVRLAELGVKVMIDEKIVGVDSFPWADPAPGGSRQARSTSSRTSA